VATIVEQWGGAVGVVSARGAGATFTVTLPLASAPTAAPHEAPSLEARGRETVAVVDDDAYVRGVVCGTLRAAGYKVHELLDATEAETLLRQNPVSLLVTDVVMPGVSGPELVERLGDACPPVLFCSGYTPDDELRRAVRDGRVALLPKPFTGPELLATIRRVLDEAATRMARRTSRPSRQ
jgi:DNA-binding NtrC family response regulator